MKEWILTVILLVVLIITNTLAVAFTCKYIDYLVQTGQASADGNIGGLVLIAIAVATIPVILITAKVIAPKFRK